MTDLQAEQLTVAVIFTPDAGKQIGLLAADMPVWVVESAENSAAVAEARKKSQWPLTVFLVRSVESRADMCSRVLFNVDEHHQFIVLKLYGMSVTDIEAETLDILRIRCKQQTDYGCCLSRRNVPI